MTVSEVIDLYDAQYKNNTDAELKMKWLLILEKTVLSDVIKTHEEPKDEEIDTETYFDDWGELKELLIPIEHSDVYVYWLDSRVKQITGDKPVRIQNSMELYNNAYITYQQWYNRNHRGLKVRKHFVRHERV